MKLKRKLSTAMLVIATLLMFALPAHAQWIYMPPYDTEYVSSAQTGSHITLSIWNTKNVPNGAEVEWSIIDGANQIIDSGTLITWYDEWYDVKSGVSSITKEYNVPNFTYKLQLYSHGGNNQVEADFVVSN